MSLLIVYHNVAPGVFCPDGIVAAWVCYKRYSSADLMGMQPIDKKTTWNEFIKNFSTFKNYSHILFVDISITPEFAENLFGLGIKTKIIDHHKSALELFNVSNLSSQLVYDVEECGATLAWKELFGKNPQPVFLPYVKDRDLGKDALEHTHAVHSGFQYALRRRSRNLESLFSLLDYFSTLTLEQFLENVLADGDRLAANRAEKVQKAYNKRIKNTVVIDGLEIPCIHLLKCDEPYHSDIAKVWMKETGFEIVALIRPEKISLRSTGEFDCSEIADRFGGGGHVQAASFAKPFEIPKEETSLLTSSKFVDRSFAPLKPKESPVKVGGVSVS